MSLSLWLRLPFIEHQSRFAENVVYTPDTIANLYICRAYMAKERESARLQRAWWRQHINKYNCFSTFCRPFIVRILVHQVQLSVRCQVFLATVVLATVVLLLDYCCRACASVEISFNSATLIWHTLLLCYAVADPEETIWPWPHIHFVYGPWTPSNAEKHNYTYLI